jgi:hypothetical protein
MKCQIEVTNYCNFVCHGCLRNTMTRLKGMMSPNTFSDALKLCKELDVDQVWLHNWGEPLLHPDIIRFVAIATRSFNVGFTTNGYYLNECVIKDLCASGLNYLDISVNGSTPTKLLSYLFNMYEVGNKYNIETSLRCVVFSNEEYRRVMNIVHPRVKLNKVKWQRGMINSKSVTRSLDCSMIDKIFMIQWDGVIVPCCETADNEIVYGHVSYLDAADLVRKGIQKIHEELPLYCKTCREVDCDIPVVYKLV